MGERLRCAIVGYGPVFNWGWVHARWMQAVPELELVAICDQNPECAGKAQRDFPEVQTFTDLETMLWREEIDLVSIVTPHNTHASLAIQCLEAGKHTVVEKPMCITVDEATRMIETAEQAGRTLAVHHNRRHDGNVRAIREVIDQGLLGDLFHVEVVAMGYSPPTRRGGGETGEPWRASKAISGGGLNDWGCTHHAMEEMALMRLIPGMTVIMPADAYETEQAVRAAAATEGPFYIALAGGTLLPGIPEAERGFEAGQAVLLRDGDAATVIGVGPTVPEALRAADLLAANGLAVRVLNVHTLKPIDREAILHAAAETPLIVTIEEHTVIGGLGGAVAEVLAEAGAGTPLRRLGLQDEFAVMCGSREDLRNRFGIGAEAVVRAVGGHVAAGAAG